MRTKFLTTAWALLAVGCLSIAFSSKPMSLLAISGIIILVLAIVSIIAGFRQPKETNRVVRLDEQQKQKIRYIRDSDGLVSAVRKLREVDPRVGLSEAKRLVDSL